MQLFSDAQTEEAASAALEKARELLWGIAPKYPKKGKLAESLATFVNHVLEAPAEIVIGIVQRFTLSVATRDPLRDLRPKVASKWVQPESVEAVSQHAHGWIKEKIDGLLLEGKPALLNVDDFKAEMLSFLPRIDFRHILPAIAGRLELTEDTIATEQ